MGISFFKIALLISYLRLLEGTAQKAYRMLVRLAIVLIFLSHVGCTLSLIFACDPVWCPDVPTSYRVFSSQANIQPFP